MEKMQKLNLRMQKLNYPGTHWRGLALIGAQKKPLWVAWNPSNERNIHLLWVHHLVIPAQKRDHRLWVDSQGALGLVTPQQESKLPQVVNQGLDVRPDGRGEPFPECPILFINSIPVHLGHLC